MNVEDILFRQQLRERLGELEYLVCGTYWELFPGSSKVGMLMADEKELQHQAAWHSQRNDQLEHEVVEAFTNLGRALARTLIMLTTPTFYYDEHAELNKLHGTDEEANAGREPRDGG